MKKIFLIGLPNVGKSTLFNLLTGSHQSVGNYSGTTFSSTRCISKKFQDTHFEITDLPGMHSFSSKKGEESIAWNAVEKAMESSDPKESVFLQVINAGEWRQSLMLTLDLQKKGIFPILFFNTKKGDKTLGEHFYTEIEKEFSTGVWAGNIEQKGFFEVFWEKFLPLCTRQNTTILPKIFPSETEQQLYINTLFQRFSKEQHNKEKTQKKSEAWKNILDMSFLNSFSGIFIFFVLLYLVFHTTFTLGSIPMDWIDGMTSGTQEFLRNILPSGLVSNLFIEGIIAGVGGTLIFLPNILVLFFFLSLLKESGYLTRVSFLFDVFFQKIGISGKASIPLLMGFGCNVPSIMAIKTFETKKEQIIVAMMTLFMSCGARLPVYTLLISVFIPESFRAISLFGIYILGMLVSFGTGKILSLAYKRKQKNRLVAYSIPPLILPSFKKALQYSGEKGLEFVKKVGKFIIPISVILWALFTFPTTEVEKFGIEESYGASIGKSIHPIFEPLGFDWRVTTALISGISAKEVMVTTFAQLYHATDEEESLQENIKNSGHFSLPSALALLVFTLLYTPCLAVIGTIRKELGTSWALFGVMYPTILAWILALATFYLANILL